MLVVQFQVAVVVLVVAVSEGLALPISFHLLGTVGAGGEAPDIPEVPVDQVFLVRAAHPALVTRARLRVAGLEGQVSLVLAAMEGMAELVGVWAQWAVRVQQGLMDQAVPGGRLAMQCQVTQTSVGLQREQGTGPLHEIQNRR